MLVWVKGFDKRAYIYIHRERVPCPAFSPVVRHSNISVVLVVYTAYAGGLKVLCPRPNISPCDPKEFYEPKHILHTRNIPYGQDLSLLRT